MPKTPKSAEKIEHPVLTLERRALDRWGKGDPDGFLEISADDVVYFDPFQPHRVNGIDALRKLYAEIRGKVHIHHYEIIDPLVQEAGEMAVLTFNYIAEGSNEVTSRWNCTEVYRQQGGEWRIIQTHWSFTDSGHGAT